MNLLTRYALLLMGLAIVGCQSAEVPDHATAVTDNLPAPTPVIAVTPAPAPDATTRTPDLANPKVASAQVVEFKPPFPERADLFEAPERAQSTVRRDDEHGQSVELKGFVNVGEPRVVLAIDGVISPIAVGGEKYGVQVISIDPPKVVVQRGRSRWTATLE